MENPVRSVYKALTALDYINAAQVGGAGAALSDIAAHLGEKPTTVRNILKTMEQCGYLERDGKAYIPGAKCGDLRRGAWFGRLLEAARPRLTRLAAELGDSFVLTGLLDGRREVLARFAGGGAVVVNPRHADGQPVYALVTTRIMLSRADAAALARFLAVNGPPSTADWPEAAADLPEALATLRTRGYAREDTATQYRAYAVALTRSDGLLLGAAGAFAAAQGLTAAHERALLDALRRVADEVALELGRP